MANILVVDDNVLNRELVVTICKHMGHHSFEASDGLEALAIADVERPDLVICDILMPTMDGYEFVRQLRADPKISLIPVIFYTANYRGKEAKNLAMSVGVTQVLIKPCEPEFIIAAIEAALANQSQLPVTNTNSFDREHLRIITDKLAEKVIEQEQLNQRLESLIDLNLQLASLRDPHSLLVQVCRAARELVGAKYAFLYVMPKHNTKESYWVTSGFSDEEAKRLNIPEVNIGLLKRVITERVAKRFQNPEGIPEAIHFPSSFPPIFHGLIAPVTSLYSVYGWLCLANKVGAEAFSDEDERVLTIHTAQMGRIYENGSLYTELEQRNNQLQREVEERKLSERKVRSLNRVYTVLSQINILIIKAHDRDLLLNETTRIATEAGQFSKAWIGLHNSDETRLEVKSARGGDESYFKKLEENLNNFTDASAERFLLALKNKQPVIINDLANEPYFELKRDALASGSRSIVWLPLVVDDKTAGVLVLHSDVENFFTADEMRLLFELADDISFAIEHLDNSHKLHYAANYDSLTGLANLALFQNRLTQHFNICGQNQTVTLALVDIERFKNINDALGRSAGNILLKQVASRLSHFMGTPDCVARLSADQFAIIFPAKVNADDVAHTIEELNNACFGIEFDINGMSLRVVSKTGLALYPNDGLDADALLKNAESALKQAKNIGDPYLFYSTPMNDRVIEKLELENRLRKAVIRGEFVLHYQPKISIQSKKIVGLEALIRWDAPGVGIVPPCEFIPLLEETGLILEVGKWVLSQAQKDYGLWKSQDGLNVPRIAVNVSALQLRQPDFVEAIHQVIKESKQPAGIDIEITESLIMEDISSNKIKLKQIRDLGLSIAIDDFGTGYSSLAYLNLLPVQTIKIDQSFITSLLDDPNTMSLVSSVISLSHALGMKVVAEGVESEEQAKILRLIRCDEIQGYLYSKPIPFDSMTTLLRNGIVEAGSTS